jgi:uncharacterized protein (DUF3820 family)
MNLEQPYYDTSLFPFKGKYYLKMLKNVPTAFLLSLYNRPERTGDLGLDEYIASNLEKLSKAPVVSVIDPSNCAKIRFTTLEEATHYINQAKEVEQEHKKPTRAYNCEKCGLWHLTSKDSIIRPLVAKCKIDFGKYEGQIFSKYLYFKDKSYWDYLQERNIVSLPDGWKELERSENFNHKFKKKIKWQKLK